MGNNGQRFDRPQGRDRGEEARHDPWREPQEARVDPGSRRDPSGREAAAREEAESESQQSNFFSGEGSSGESSRRAFENRPHRDGWSDDERNRDQRLREERERQERDREWSAADRERAQHRPQGNPARSRFWQREPLTAREVMTSDVRTVTAEASVEEIAKLMRELDVGIVPVVDLDRRLLGVVTDRDLVVRALAEPDGARKKAGDLASKDLETIASDASISQILEIMGKRQVRRLPVVDVRGVLLGMVSVGDIAHRADQDEELQHALQRISGRRSFWSRLWG